MANVSEARLRVWTYRELMGSLGDKKRKLLKKALDEKQENNELEPLERRIWSAMMVHRDNVAKQREYLNQELKLWERRTA